jgi:tripartite-type tricarboxylate transporter receptor subunit TctC
MVPAKTPPDIVSRLNREILTILRSDDVRTRLAAEGAEVLGGTPAEFAMVLRDDIRKWTKLAAGLKLQLD